MIRGLDMYGLVLGNINALHCHITDSMRPFFHTKIYTGILADGMI